MIKSLLKFSKNRLPATNEIYLALSMAAFLVFSWSLREFLFNFPAFMLSYGLGEILVIAAYVLMFALFETLVVMFVAVFLAVILPWGLLKNGFAYKASFLFIAFGFISVKLQFVMTNQPKPEFLLWELVRALVYWLVPVLLTHYIAFIRKIVLDLLDRLTIFSFIYIPLGALSLIVVFVRLLW
jgi:hypothetical protein